ncbi:CD2 antigen cytoplasmic tail-binding protein 2 homolog [Agrilus planipennis]|uniref:CD2 antigen cytoplasmic tail-binding protein 2 homolog n=1 Tax=Agrilus planipennis TaxID=224129 RepID=A0A1W4WUN1_AGRPL|nr:CD2 antigen cytoplasmic tail-binding protein 2 homolog [Agrilus planipennis]
MYKRKLLEEPTASSKRVFKQKHSLDSDEEDVEDDDNVLDEREIEGEEEGYTKNVEGQYVTAFNMREEMEEGHFDRNGHFIWKNEKEIRDNWLDNIDWQRVASVDKYKLTDDSKGLGDESTDDEDGDSFNEEETYKAILKYLKEKETISKALNRLSGDTKKLSSIERLKRKKEGTLIQNKEVTELTQLANEILTNKGNMDIYQETYEIIQSKIKTFENKKKSRGESSMLDMYADDFEAKEQQQLKEMPNCITNNTDTMWEIKWKNDEEKIDGPFSTEQMAKWSEEGHFKEGVFVRKVGDDSNFYSSNRVDFELYL